MGFFIRLAQQGRYLFLQGVEIMLYAMPNQPGSKATFKSRYANFINNEWVAPKRGQYFQNISPVTGVKHIE